MFTGEKSLTGLSQKLLTKENLCCFPRKNTFPLPPPQVAKKLEFTPEGPLPDGGSFLGPSTYAGVFLSLPYAVLKCVPGRGMSWGVRFLPQLHHFGK